MGRPLDLLRICADACFYVVVLNRHGAAPRLYSVHSTSPRPIVKHGLNVYSRDREIHGLRAIADGRTPPSVRPTSGLRRSTACKTRLKIDLKRRLRSPLKFYASLLSAVVQLLLIPRRPSPPRPAKSPGSFAQIRRSYRTGLEREIKRASRPVKRVSGSLWLIYVTVINSWANAAQSFHSSTVRCDSAPNVV